MPPEATGLTLTHHAELLRTYQPPWRGLLSKATSPRSSALSGPTKNLRSERHEARITCTPRERSPRRRVTRVRGSSLIGSQRSRPSKVRQAIEQQITARAPRAIRCSKPPKTSRALGAFDPWSSSHVRHVSRVGSCPSRVQQRSERGRSPGGSRPAGQRRAAPGRQLESHSMTQSLKLAVIPGDGIGPEVTAEALKVLEQVTPAGVKFESTRYDLGAERYLATGEVLPDSVLAEIKQHDAILLGAVGGKPGDPNLPPGILERGLLLRLRFELDHYVNLRPSRIFPGAKSPLANPGEVDFVVVREGTEGPYVGNGGALRVGTPAEIATEVSVNTAFGVERVVRDAFARAAKRPRKKLTLVHKTNVLVHAGAVWSRIVDEVAREHPEVEVDYLHIDAATIFMTTDPSRFDVIVTDNLFGDIITDLAAAITGGIGLAASGNVNPDRTAPSMFEPVHGSAPDIAGQQKADPTAAILSVALLLEHLERDDAARKVEEAVVADLAERADVPARRTSEVSDAIAARVAR